MYSDPSGLEPKKEKSKAKLLISTDASDTEMMKNIIDYTTRMNDENRRYAEYMMSVANQTFNRWQIYLDLQFQLSMDNGGGGSSSGSGSGEPFGILLSDMNESNEDEQNQTNNDRGNLTSDGKERGTGKGDIPYPYSNDFVDNYNDGLKHYIAPETIVYGAKPNQLVETIGISVEIAWDMMNTSETNNGVIQGMPPGGGLVKGAFQRLGKTLKYSWFNSKYIGIESKYFAKKARKGGRGAERAGILNNNNIARLGWGWYDKKNSYTFRISFGEHNPSLGNFSKDFDFIKIPYKP